MVEPAKGGHYTVIEGNRRLVAVKAIVDRKFRKAVGAEGFEDFSCVFGCLDEKHLESRSHSLRAKIPICGI